MLRYKSKSQLGHTAAESSLLSAVAMIDLSLAGKRLSIRRNQEGVR